MNDFYSAYYSELCEKALNEYTYITYDEFLRRYNESHRYFHTMDHLESIFTYLNNEYKWMVLNDVLVLTTMFHDIIYYPHFTNNEYRSAKFLEDNWKYSADLDVLNEVKTCILDTKDRKNVTEYCAIFNEADLATLYNSSYTDLIKYERQIRREYSFMELNEYIEKRLQFLSTLINDKTMKSLNDLTCIINTKSTYDNLDVTGEDSNLDLF